MRFIDPALAQLVTPHASRHGISRRTALKAGVATGALLAASAVRPSRAFAAAPASGDPVPVPANPDAFGLHVYFVDPNAEPASITDFNGKVGAAIVDGSGLGTTSAGTKRYLFDTDMRFMQGVFRDTTGRTQTGTFAFV